MWTPTKMTSDPDDSGSKLYDMDSKKLEAYKLGNLTISQSQGARCCRTWFAPLDIPSTMDAFLQYWRPNAVMLMESELWPNLIMGASRNGNVYKIIPELVSPSRSSTDHVDAIKIFIDSPIAIADFNFAEGDKKSLEEFKAQLSNRKVWMASSIHKGEEDVFIGAHNMLKQKHADILTIIVPRQPQHGQDIAQAWLCCLSQQFLKLQKLREEGICVALRSRGDNPTPETSVYVVDSLGELRNFYRLTPIAVIGGSFLLGLAGHNISEAAAAGCAILTGRHVGHFSHMVAEMQRVNPFSVLQVTNEKLVEAVDELFDNVKILEARRVGARQAFHALSNGIVESDEGNDCKERMTRYCAEKGKLKTYYRHTSGCIALQHGQLTYVTLQRQRSVTPSSSSSLVSLSCANKYLN
ncbi:probable 3-deoxy-d-manno-octulosonic acid transferase mitochondrial [Phtheirospermum japonicum]|uniref:lipid IVA 3-deoxy-D-manno-octulosonic acid transferase n=1 Tax=Phtheirospermum japonicum TaxID=374723 RepID=A0A830CH02_9LAMI|nr:probable 3-deoxy-d-manno-octulosonic acid transferase mitochondrial [Phtheirospermum japonicum]